MTNKEAITRLKGLYGNGYTEQEQALDMAIQALRQTDGDLISREEAIKQLENLCGECNSSFCGDCRLNCKGTNIKDVFDVLTKLPSITPVIISDTKFYDDYKAELDIRKKNDDLISQQALLEKLHKYRPVIYTEKTANWVALDDYPYEDWECDNCSYTIFGVEEPYRFCPNCGRRMKGVGE